MKKAIINANVVLENGIIFDGVVLIENDRILNVGTKDEISAEGYEIIDAQGAYVGPGFVDIHVHRGTKSGIDVTIEDTVEYFLAHGTTSFLPTLGYTFSFSELLEKIKHIKEVAKHSSSIKGINMEGPYINIKYGAGVFLLDGQPIPKKDEYAPIVAEGGEFIKIWTVAPEVEGIKDFMKDAKKANPGVVFSVGHSEATPEQIRALGVLKPRLQTHFGDATGRVSVPKGIRGVGPDEYGLLEPEIYTEMISDSCGIHVLPDMQRLLISVKGVSKVVLITDCTDSELPAPKELEHIKDLNFDERGGISGSRLTMNLACRNVMAHTNCGIAQAFVMASLNPAKVIGLDDEIGSIAVGKKADIVFVDDKFNVLRVIAEGKMI
ncbi:MAG: amidohydrolase family protein [Clostridia bacterium]|nr:amidohydrolase family protein [Clostridia bacterium]